MTSEASPAHQDTDRGVRGSLWMVGGRFLAVGVGLVTQVTLVRVLSLEEYGAWALGIAIAMGLRILISLGQNRAAARFFSIYRERHDASRLLGTLVLLAGLIVALGGLALVAALLVVNLLGDGGLDHGTLVMIMLLLAPLQALEELLENLFASFGWVLPIVVRQHVLIPLLRFSVVVALAATGGSVEVMASGYVSVSVLSLGFYALMLRRLFRREDLLRTRPRSGVTIPYREVLRFSPALMTGELVYLVNGTGNAVLLGAIRGPVEVGSYRAVLPFADANLLVRRQFFRLFVPLAAAMQDRGDRPGLVDAYWRTAGWVALLSFPVVALTGPFADPLAATLLGADYSESGRYLALLAFAYYANAAVGFNVELLVAAARLGWVAAVNVTAAFMSLGIALALIPSLGAMGAAVATCASVLLQNLLNQVGLRRHLGSVWPPAAYGLLFGSITALLVALVALDRLLAPDLVLGCLLAAAASTIVAAVAVPVLKPAQTFPVLRRVRFLRRFG